MVVWVAWHRLTILGGGAVWGGTGMGLGKREELNMQVYSLKKTQPESIVTIKVTVSVVNHQGSEGRGYRPVDPQQQLLPQ